MVTNTLYLSKDIFRHFKRVLFFLVIINIPGCQTDIPPAAGNRPGSDINPNIYNWTYQISDLEIDFMDVHFIDSKIGWVVGEFNTILSTNSGGLTWPLAPVISHEGNFRSVHLVDDQNGWISGDLNGKNIDGNIYLSTSGGAYPESQLTTLFPVNTVFSLDQHHVWCGGGKGQIMYSIDGGTNWKESITNLEFEVFDMFFLDTDLGYAAGSQGNIIKTTDGGETWLTESKFDEIDILSIHFTDYNEGWACGTKNTILLLKSVGEEMEWTVETISYEVIGTTWRDIFFTDEQTGWVVGDAGLVYKSEDGGMSWVKETTGTFSNLNAIHMINDQSGWIVGDEGIILTYTPITP